MLEPNHIFGLQLDFIFSSTIYLIGIFILYINAISEEIPLQEKKMNVSIAKLLAIAFLFKLIVFVPFFKIIIK